MEQRIIVLEEFPDGTFNIALKNNGEQAVFDHDEKDAYPKAVSIKFNLQKGHIVFIPR